MKHKKFLERVVSIVCMFAFVCFSYMQPAAAVFETASNSADDRYHTEIVWHNDSDFTVLEYMDNDLVQDVSGSVGKDILTVKSYSTDEAMMMTEPEIQEIQVSSIITKAKGEDNSEDASEPLLAAYNSYAGSVEYRVLADKYYYYTLDIYYDIVDESEVDDYELHADKNTAIGILAGAITAAIGIYIESEILEVILVAMGGAFASGKLTKDVNGVFKGTKYDCNLMAEAEDGRSETYSGASFDGKAKKRNGSWKTVKAYEGYYPQFIRERDTGVASWLFDEFFTGTFDVYRWNSEI